VSQLEPNGTKRRNGQMLSSTKIWWPGTELNRRRQPFQGCALPPELPGHVLDSQLGRWRRALYSRPRRCLSRISSKNKQSNAGSVWNSQDYSNHLGFTQRAAVLMQGLRMSGEEIRGLISNWFHTTCNLHSEVRNHALRRAAIFPFKTVNAHRLVANQ
jgi:hypothetical protein